MFSARALFGPLKEAQMLRLLPAVEQPQPPEAVCRHATCWGVAVDPYGFCERRASVTLMLG
jgi:hypothetical protein